jgi:hypothetical protein
MKDGKSISHGAGDSASGVSTPRHGSCDWQQNLVVSGRTHWWYMV